jgi:hypothetical protein
VLANVENVDSRAARFRSRSGEQVYFEPSTQSLIEMEESIRDGTVDDLVALAERFPHLADQILFRTLMKARLAGDLDLMRKITDRIKGSPERRQRMLDMVADAQRAVTFDEAELAKMETKLNETPSLQKRVELLISSAYRAGAGNRALALKLLNRAEQMVDTMSPGKEQSHSQILLAMFYCFEKDDHGFAIMESLVPKLNSLVDAAVRLDGYDTSYLREGEWNMSAGGMVGELLTRLSQGAEFFAWSDFDRAMSLTGQFERAEIRMMAQLKLAQSILAGPHKRKLITAGY